VLKASKWEKKIDKLMILDLPDKSRQPKKN
jgi:hypothetical protein